MDYSNIVSRELSEEQQEIIKEVAEQIRKNTDTIDYIEDTITERADGLVDIYNNDLRNWAGTLQGQFWTERAIEEFGWSGVGEELIKAYQSGQFIMYERALREELEDLL